MVSINKVQAGFAKFVDSELVPALSGWEKIIVGGGSGLLAAKLPDIISKYTGSEIVSAMGLYDAESGMIDVEALYNAIAPKIGAEKLPIKLPLIGITVKIGRPEIDLLYQYIMEG